MIVGEACMETSEVWETQYQVRQQAYMIMCKQREETCWKILTSEHSLRKTIKLEVSS